MSKKLSTLELIEHIETLYGAPLAIISDCLRGMIAAPPGKTLVAGDFSNIEGRVLAWLAGEEWKLQVFRDFDAGVGPDIYKLSYAKSFRVPVEAVTKDQRQVGKVQELALGYQGGVGAFQTMARGYGVKVTDERAEEIKAQWREAHPRIRQYWYDIENAAKEAVTHPGSKVSVRSIDYVLKGSFLFCRLPSGRVLTYPYPKLRSRETPWGELREQIHYMKVDGLTNKWEETHTYGGSLVENCTQAVARDVLAHSMTKLSDKGWNICLTIHDEIVSETTDGMLADHTRIMAEIPQWAPGLPIAVEGWQGRRYRKG